MFPEPKEEQDLRLGILITVIPIIACIVAVVVVIIARKLYGQLSQVVTQIIAQRKQSASSTATSQTNPPAPASPPPAPVMVQTNSVDQRTSVDTPPPPPPAWPSFAAIAPPSQVITLPPPQTNPVQPAPVDKDQPPQPAATSTTLALVPVNKTTPTTSSVTPDDPASSLVIIQPSVGPNTTARATAPPNIETAIWDELRSELPAYFGTVSQLSLLDFSPAIVEVGGQRRWVRYYNLHKNDPQQVAAVILAEMVVGSPYERGLGLWLEGQPGEAEKLEFLLVEFGVLLYPPGFWLPAGDTLGPNAPLPCLDEINETTEQLPAHFRILERLAHLELGLTQLKEHWVRLYTLDRNTPQDIAAIILAEILGRADGGRTSGLWIETEPGEGEKVETILTNFNVTQACQKGLWMPQTVAKEVQSYDTLTGSISQAVDTFTQKTQVKVYKIEPYLTLRTPNGKEGVIHFEVGLAVITADTQGNVPNPEKAAWVEIPPYGFWASPPENAHNGTEAAIHEACAMLMQAMIAALTQYISTTGHVPTQLNVRYEDKVHVDMVQEKSLEEAPILPPKSEAQPMDKTLLLPLTPAAAPVG